MSKINKLVYFILSIFFFSFLDLYLSNLLILNIDKFTENRLLNLVYIENTGAAFSILQDYKLFLILFAFFAIIWLLYFTIRQIKIVSSLSLFFLSMLVSGIFCNLYERISLGFVRDFFQFNFINFPVFNISDVLINFSVLAIIIIIIRQNFSKNNENNN